MTFPVSAVATAWYSKLLNSLSIAAVRKYLFALSLQFRVHVTAEMRMKKAPKEQDI
jgi:hypothetical protein